MGFKVSATGAIEDGSGGPATFVGQVSPKNWCTWDGSGTVSIKDSYNVSSLTDNATGNYTLDFTAAMSDANWAAVSAAGNTSSDPSDPNSANVVIDASSCKYELYNSAGDTQNDQNEVYAIGIGDLA